MGEIRYFNVRLEDVEGRLREYFNRRGDVLIAILFGSILGRSTVRDVDVAVHMASGGLEDIVRMGWMLEEILGVPVDVAPLTQLPPDLRLKILLQGKPILVRSRAAYAELLKISISELEDIRVKYS